MQEHDRALTQLSALSKATQAIAVHGFSQAAYLKILAALEYIEDEVGVHNRSEEEALFPVLERYVEGPTQLMREEHKELRKEFSRLRKAVEKLEKTGFRKESAERLREASRSMVHLFVNHIHKENHILFPLVQKFLTRDALREVARRMV
jgi:iron-sulfur cluster repair protein YtfE (RIC family)